MKRVVTFVLVLLMIVFAFVGCNGATTPAAEDSAASQAPAKTDADTTAQASTGAATTGEMSVADIEEYISSYDYASTDKLKVMFMPKVMGLPFYVQAETGAQQAGEDFNLEVTFVGPTEASAVDQAKMLEDNLTAGWDAIVVAPNDAETLTPVLNEYKDAGVMVFDFDSKAEEGVTDFSVVPVEVDIYARQIWDTLVEYMGTDEGDYAIITGGADVENLNSWLDAGEAYAAEKYPNLHLVTERIPTDEKQQVAYEKTLELLQTYPDLKGIIDMGAGNPPGVSQAMRENNRQDIAHVGTCLPNDAKEWVTDGSFDCSLLWDPADMCYVAAYVVRAVNDGLPIADGITINGVGPIVYDGDKNISLGSAMLFTEDNLDQYDF